MRTPINRSKNQRTNQPRGQTGQDRTGRPAGGGVSKARAMCTCRLSLVLGETSAFSTLWSSGSYIRVNSLTMIRWLVRFHGDPPIPTYSAHTSSGVPWSTFSRKHFICLDGSAGEISNFQFSEVFSVFFFCKRSAAAF